EDGGASEVAEEARPEAVARVRALDQPRDVREDEARVLGDAGDAGGGGGGGERVAGARRRRRGEGADERRLADVREAEEARVGKDAELEAKLAALARPARLGGAGGGVSWR